MLALRYLVTRWVNLLGMIGVAVAVWALIVVISVFSGFIGEIREGVRNTAPDLLVTDLPPRAAYGDVEPWLRGDPDVASTAPRLHHYGILYPHGYHARHVQTARALFDTTRLTNNFVRLIGIDPAREAETTQFRGWLDAVASPDYRVERLDAPFRIDLERIEPMRRRTQDLPRAELLRQEPGLLLGLRRVTEGERVEPGGRVDVVTGYFGPRAEDGQRPLTSVRRATVLTGAFAPGHRVLEETAALVDIEFLRELLGEGADDPHSVELVTHVAVRLRDGADAAAAAARLEAVLAQHGGGRVLTWEQQNRTFLDAVDQERGMMKVVLFAVMLVAAFLIYATLHMMVTQKVRDIGVLTAMGGTPRGIAAIFLGCGSVIALAGCALGTAAGMLSAIYLNDVNDFCRAHFQVELFPTSLYSLDRIPFRLEWSWIAQVIGAAAALALIVAYLPARRAARLDPVKALYHT
jgi:ABC-type lipoprotein release transport system permease subunit